jgi:hypothetical protein
MLKLTKLVESLAHRKLERVLDEIVSVDFTEVITRLVNDIVLSLSLSCHLITLVDVCKCQVSRVSALYSMDHRP